MRSLFGTLLALSVVAPASAGTPAVAITIDPIGSASDDGLATVSGRADCPSGASAVADVRVRQVVGGMAIEGFATIPVVCGQRWVAPGVFSNKVDSQGNSLYELGPANVFFFGSFCFDGSCVDATAERNVTLRAGSYAGAGWEYIGSGPQATSAGTAATVLYPNGVTAGDLLMLSCQGKRITMRWSAPGFVPTEDYDTWGGPPGLRHAILLRWADGTEGAVVTVRNTTGVNGWSCVISVFHGGSGPGEAAFHYERAVVGQPARVMTVAGGASAPGVLELSWFVSGDDNNHGQPSPHGTLAFGGPAYDTTIGTDHAVSMAFHVTDAAFGTLTMRQRSNAPDWYGVHVIGLLPAAP